MVLVVVALLLVKFSSVVEFTPATREAQVRFLASTVVHYILLYFQIREREINQSLIILDITKTESNVCFIIN